MDMFFKLNNCSFNKDIKITGCIVTPTKLPSRFDDMVPPRIKEQLSDQFSKVTINFTCSMSINIFGYEFNDTFNGTILDSVFGEVDKSYLERLVDYNTWNPSKNFHTVIGDVLSGKVHDLIMYKRTTTDTLLSKYEYHDIFRFAQKTSDLMKLVDYLISLGHEADQFTAEMVDWSPMFYEALEMDKISGK